MRPRLSTFMTPNSRAWSARTGVTAMLISAPEVMWKSTNLR